MSTLSRVTSSMQPLIRKDRSVMKPTLVVLSLLLVVVICEVSHAQDLMVPKPDATIPLNCLAKGDPCNSTNAGGAPLIDNQNLTIKVEDAGELLDLLLKNLPTKGSLRIDRYYIIH